MKPDCFLSQILLSSLYDDSTIILCAPQGKTNLLKSPPFLRVTQFHQPYCQRTKIWIFTICGLCASSFLSKIFSSFRPVFPTSYLTHYHSLSFIFFPSRFPSLRSLFIYLSIYPLIHIQLQ